MWVWDICFVPTTYLTTGVTVSCGCKNEENRASLPNLDYGLVDGTMLCGNKKDRKLNKKTIPQEYEVFILIKIDEYE